MPPIGRQHTVEQWQLAVVVEVHAHAQVNFGRVGVGIELFVETQNRVARGHFDSGKERHGGSCSEWYWKKTENKGFAGLQTVILPIACVLTDLFYDCTQPCLSCYVL